MRFYELLLENTYDGLDNFVTMLQNLVGRYTSKQQRAVFSWKEISGIAKNSEFEMLGDEEKAYDTFVTLWEKNPKAKALLEPLVKNFNGQQIELDIPGVSDTDQEKSKDGESPEDAVAKTAAGAVNKQIAQNQQGVQV